MDKISIIMPVKNAGLFLEPCLQSIKRQRSTGFEFELIAIDDHSSDESANTLSTWARNESWVISCISEGTGTLDALNTGYRLTKGNYITRMDADDLMSEDKLALFHKALKASSPKSVATGKVSYFRDDLPLGDGFKRYEQWLNRLVDTQSFYKEIYRECPVASANWMMTREDFDAIGGFGSTYPEDYDMVFRWQKNEMTIIGIDSKTHLWRDHGARASRNLDQYKDNRFLDLKVHWFLDMYGNGDRLINLIGAGRKGKEIASILESEGVKFSWFTNNDRKVGHVIKGVELDTYDPNSLNQEAVTIVALGSPDDQDAVTSDLENLGLQHGEHFFFFA